MKSIVVVSHILDVMKDEFTRSIFGMDLTSILLKDILSNYKHQCELSSKIWHGMHFNCLKNTLLNKVYSVIYMDILQSANDCVMDPDRYLDHLLNLADCCLAQDTPLVIVLCKAVHYFVSNPSDGLPNKQTLSKT